MPSQDPISHAARFFVLAEQASRLDILFYVRFWDLSAPLVAETAIHLPALTAVVSKTFDSVILDSVNSPPLPGVLPPEAVPWHNRLIAAWEVHRASSSALLQNIVRQALVRLDGCGMPKGQERPSRLPEWLAEARKIASGEWRVASGEGQMAYQKLQALAALAAWRPAARVITPPETLREWVAFWMQIGQSEDPVEKGIAAIARLNLPEADLRAASIPPVPAGELLQQLATSIQSAAEKTDTDYIFLLNLLDWQPVKETTWPVAEVENVAQTWLDVAKNGHWHPRCTAWRQLIRWDRAGCLDICGMDLLPELVQAIPTEENSFVLRELAQWVASTERLTATGMPDRCSQLQQLEGAWKRYRNSMYFWHRTAAWLAGIRLYQAGLSSEPPESFMNAYLSSLAGESYTDVLFILARWSPGADAPRRWHRDWHKAWQQRLLDEDESIQQVAAWALLRQSLEKASDRSLRGAALEQWRTGVEVSPKARHILDAAFSRFQEVRARLAAGEVVDFEGEPTPPAERCRPPLALPPGRIAGGEWQMENEKLKMENGEWGMKHQEVTVKPNLRLVPDCLSRSGMSE